MERISVWHHWHESMKNTARCICQHGTLYLPTRYMTLLHVGESHNVYHQKKGREDPHDRERRKVPFHRVTSIVGKVCKDLTIDCKDRALAYETDKNAIGINDGKSPGMGTVEGGHYDIHRIVHGKHGLRLCHQS